jgi:predicted secreted hydrolase
VKTNRARWLVAPSLALLFVTAAGSCSRDAAVPAGPKMRLAPAPPVRFARAVAPRAFRLPEDHGPHFEFQTEWWYYTGNLLSAEGRRFGFQLTFFRRGLSPGRPPALGLATNQIYFAHFALTDAAAGRHRSAERFSRGAAGLAGAQGRPFRVWLEDWKVESRNADGSSLHVRARDGGMLLDLELEARKPLVAHGDRGLSRKSEEPGNASYYVGYTRLAARGRIGSDGKAVAAEGEAWFDHEWSTSALGPQAVGWDWWSLQLDDDRELMLFLIRRADGSAETTSGGTLVARDGTTRRLRRDDVAVQVVGRWTSPESRAEYPARWWLRVPSEDLALEISPRVSDQEMRTSFTYWEGAVQVEGVSRGRRVAGQGYVELTGYARSMQGVF